MQRIPCPERDDWRETAARCGFDFHELDGERYWDERAYYAFTLAEIELGIEEPTGEIEQMCLELVSRVVKDEVLLRRLKIPDRFWPLLASSWKRKDDSLYGRLDLSFQGGRAPAKLLEYNSDTPTSIFEAAVFQWTWLEQAIERRILPGRADQYNSIHERLIERWRLIGKGRPLHLAGLTDAAEDAATLAYLADTATQAGLSTTILDMADIGWREAGGFVDLDNKDIALAFKLYPWEFMLREMFSTKLEDAGVRWLEPAWKSIISNKALLPMLWEMFPNHPNLLAAYFSEDTHPEMEKYVIKPIFSREGANVSIVENGKVVEAVEGPYGEEGTIVQAFYPLPKFGDSYTLIGSWLINDQPAGIGIREDRALITQDLSRFYPHIFVE